MPSSTDPINKDFDAFLDEIILDLVHQGSLLPPGKTINAGMFAEAKARITRELVEQRRSAKISFLNQLSNKVTPQGEDIHPEFTKGFDCMKQKFKFELQRLRKQKGTL